MTEIDFAEVPILVTERLRLRPWKKSDLEPYIAMGADKEVMKFFPECLDRAKSLDHVRDLQDRFRQWGYGYWAVESEDVPFAGWVGLSQLRIDADFAPCVEIGWRLARSAWGQGYASEGAIAALRFGFENHSLNEIVAVVSIANEPSCRVAERIGMTRNPSDDFDYPNEWEYKACALYRITREKFMSMAV